MDHIHGFNRKQEILFPSKIDDYIGEDNLVRFIEAFVALLDLVALGFTHSKIKTTGRPPYNPADILKLYIYGYLNNIRSSRKLEKECHRNVEVMWLLKKLAPDHKTIADFRKDNADPLKSVFKEFVFFCKALDLYGREVVAIDGSKFKAVNSKKRNFNKDRLIKKLNDIDAKIEAFIKELDENDNNESTITQPDAKELNEKIKQFEERKSEYQELLNNLENSDEKQVSLTDPDSRMMKNNQRFEVCYNVQTIVDDKNNIIVDYEVTNDVNDKRQLYEMSSKAKEVLDVESLDVLADKGYYNAEDIKKCVENNTIPYIPRPETRQPKKSNVPESEFYESEFHYNANKDVFTCPMGCELTFNIIRKKNDKMMKEYMCDGCNSCECKTKCTSNKKGRVIFRWEHEEILDEMQQRVTEKKDVVRKRNCMSEHPFGTIKRGFNQGYFLLKGLRKVGGEMSLTMLAYNMKRVINILGVDKLLENMNPA